MNVQVRLPGTEHWTSKGDVKLFIWNKVAGDPAKTRGTILFVHGSSMASQPTFDLEVPGRPDSSAMEYFARQGYDCWCVDMEGYGRSTKDRDNNAPIAQGADGRQPVIRACTVARPTPMWCRPSAERRQAFVHHEGIDEAQPRVFERRREPPDNLESVGLPRLDGALVGAHHEIELHREKAARPGVFERVFEHGAADARSLGIRRCHVAAVGHVSAAAHLVRLEKVGAENPLRFFSDEDVMAFALPVFQRIAPAHVSREGIGLSCADHRLQDGPDRVAIVGSRASNHRHGSLCRMGSIRGSTDTYSSKVARNVTGAEGRRRHAR